MTELATPSPYPLRVEGELDGNLSRGLWLAKWILLIPHFVVLLFLWIAFVLVTVVAFFAIVITGRHPRGMFDFKLGVMRWRGSKSSIPRSSRVVWSWSSGGCSPCRTTSSPACSPGGRSPA